MGRTQFLGRKKMHSRVRNNNKSLYLRLNISLFFFFLERKGGFSLNGDIGHLNTLTHLPNLHPQKKNNLPNPALFLLLN